jgi:hypothetical protein
MSTECFYAELIEMLKKKDREKNKTSYQQIELDLPIIEQIETDTQPTKNDIDKHGVIVIELM